MKFKEALNKFRKDVWAKVSSVYICIVCLVAIFAYQIAPDKTQYANQMHLSIHSQAPGFSCKLLIIPRLLETEKKKFSKWGFKCQ